MKKYAGIVVVVVLLFLGWWYMRRDQSGALVASPSPTPAQIQANEVQESDPSVYVVKPGDYLRKIAEEQYGSPDKWSEIAMANNLANPNVIQPGQELKLPGKEVEPAKAEAFTLAQVAEHPNRESCWLAIEGKVYDVTPFIAGGFHPGKAAILQGCGRDATELFNTRPMARNPSPHSERARAMLPKYYIGELAQE